jgi:hypothetical protein
MCFVTHLYHCTFIKNVEHCLNIVFAARNPLEAAIALSLSCGDETLNACVGCDVRTDLTSAKLKLVAEQNASGF